MLLELWYGIWETWTRERWKDKAFKMDSLHHPLARYIKHQRATQSDLRTNASIKKEDADPHQPKNTDPKKSVTRGSDMRAVYLGIRIRAL